ncbi:hypothetical protein FZEAL_202 [Fusarium zealandicum]|uniref:Aimless RasGEF n=1 Tax=Fusarium zealandicum TaxID=1053134 RepID=A0A8H4XR34_9HYPO|nr:hypothetical protein FZEAL_202 [Fusarium zealandicum]
MQSDHAGSRHAHSIPGFAAASPTSRPYPLASPAASYPNTESDSDPSDPGSNHRDSVGSIIDDPFFQTYDPAIHAAAASDDDGRSDGSSVYQSLDDEDYEHQFHGLDSPNAADRTKPASFNDGGEDTNISPDSDDNDPSQSWLPRRESLTATPSSYWSPSSSAMEGYNIAVIGSTGVGKSSFVQRVLGLSRPPISNASSVRMLVDATYHVITLLELDLEYFELNPTQPIQWPKQINGHIVPRVDAALILYDVTNHESVRELPQTLAALTNSGLPASLVACKCETPEADWQVNAEAIANHQLFKSCISTYKISSENAEVPRTCLHTILRAAMAHRKEENGETVSRRRAQSAANLEAPDASSGRPISQHSKHSRASSDFSLLKGFSNPPNNENHRAQASRSPRAGHQPSTSPTPSSVHEMGDPGQTQTVSSMLRTPGIRLDKPNTDSFLDVDESDGESYRYSDDIPILQRNDDNVLDKPVKVTGVSFDELVDRLLAPRLSRSEINFSEVFLCLYRKFAAPGELFSATLTRLDKVRDDKSAHYLSKTATQLRIIEVVAKWVSIYPGDFARPQTRRNLEEFIRHLSTEPIFSIAAQHMRRHLQFNVVEDDDTGWANCDETSDKIASEILSKDMAELSSGVSVLTVEDDTSGRPSGSSETSFVDRGSSVGSQVQFHTYDDYEREAAILEPSENLPMNKFRYHIFMEIPDDDVADELTRIDWIMFSSIRIRDFVRHVSLSAAQKEKCKSLRNVNRMISHFNHVAKWVANMILLRDKAKHRAQILEKFMNIALKLRQLNNYNGLAAVLAGVNGTAIHRLTQTRSLVSTEVQKRFARLGILMGTQKSHSTYRLAWDNSPLPRIPFIPLHRRDLVSAEEGSKTFVGADGDRINWKKFEVLGDVLLPVMKSQGTPYPNLTKHDTARELILGCRMPTDEEDIYQRSVQVESTTGGMADPAKKKFPCIRISTKKVNLELTASPSLCVDLPDDFSHVTTIDELQTVMRDAHLWIARTGPCEIEVSIAINARMILDNGCLHGIAKTIQHSQVWDRLGIRLEHNRGSAAQFPGLLSFSIQHPDLTSALVAPVAARTAPFRSLILAINIAEPVKTSDSPDQDHTRPNKRRRNTDVPKRKSRTEAVERNDLLATLEVGDQQAIESFITSLNIQAKDQRRERTPQRRESDDMATCIRMLENLQSSSIMDILLEQLMFAPKKKYRGHRILGDFSAYCMTKTAPGVFHMPYLMDMSSRAQLLPVIATSLARMKNAESPVLRQKVAGLELVDIKSRDSGNEWEGTIRGIEKQAWDVLLTTTQIPPLTERRRRRKPARPMLDSPASEIPIANERLDSVLREPGVRESHTFFNNEAQEYAAVSVNWAAMHSPPDLSQHEESTEESQGMTATPTGAHHNPWASPLNSPAFLTWPEGQLRETSWLGSDTSMAGYGAGSPLAQGYDSMFWGEQVPQSLATVSGEGVMYDPGSFQSLEHYLFCGEAT